MTPETLLGTLGSVPLRSDRLEPLHRLTVEDLDRMAAAGILDEDDRIELLDSVIIEMSTEGPPHALVVSRLVKFFVVGRGDDASLMVRAGNPMRLPPWSQPAPDLSIVDAADATWRTHPERAHLLIEVA